MNLIIFVILLLATWRISHLLAHEDGPFEILATFRYAVGVRYEEGPPYDPIGRNVFATMIVCVWCNSVWVGLSCTLLYLLWRPIWWFALPFALSAAAILIEESLPSEVKDG